ncbi:MAG TPA: hypothetical protein VJ810_19765 [Blastocatellia bacterium]|nr:hypothetical protein [Blastocatellia bacterium]
MAKSRNKKKSIGARQPVASTPVRDAKRWLAPVAIVAMLSAAAVIFYYGNSGKQKNAATKSPPANAQSAGVTTQDTGATGEPAKMNVAQAVVVTAELDFGGPPPPISQAIQQIERSYEPDDGGGRTFAILDAFGEPVPDGKKLRMSMRVSSEKPGMGMLKFKRTGQVLWRARIGAPGDPAASQKGLRVFLSQGRDDGANYTLDASRSDGGVLDTYLEKSQQRARDVWPDGAEREMTFIYSACGCPVKVMCRRMGERTERTKNTPVIFPDDPAVVATISNLMRW